MKIGLLAGPLTYEAHMIAACEERGVPWEVIDLLADDWLDQFRSRPCEGYLIRPPAALAIWRTVFFRRLFLLRDSVEGRCVPTMESIAYYESKIHMHDIARMHEIPTPETKVFFRFREAWEYVSKVPLPVIVKSDGGACAINVVRVGSRLLLKWIAIRSFFTNYCVRRFCSPFDWFRAVREYGYRWKVFFRSGGDYFWPPERMQGCLIVQNAVDVKAEWRIIVIGRRFWGHQKALGARGFHSGSHLKNWSPPPLRLLDMVESWYGSLKLNAAGFDIFEDHCGSYLINEIQAITGARHTSQMYIDGVPGCYVREKGEWTFVEGEFSRNANDSPRLEALIELVSGGSCASTNSDGSGDGGPGVKNASVIS